MIFFRLPPTLLLRKCKANVVSGECKKNGSRSTPLTLTPSVFSVFCARVCVRLYFAQTQTYIIIIIEAVGTFFVVVASTSNDVKFVQIFMKICSILFRFSVLYCVMHIYTHSICMFISTICTHIL